MSAMQNYLENGLVDFIFRAQSLTIPATIYVGLFTAAPSDSGGGTEVTGGQYARAAITRSLAAWAGTQSAGSTTTSTGTGGLTSNNTAITFTTPTAGWGTITHFGVFTNQTGGDLLFHGSLSVPQTIQAGNSVSWAAGQFQVTLS